MNCEAVREMLWAYLEKETTAEEAGKIEEHLKHCADCREELELQKEMMETLAGLPDEELPEGYHTELMQKLQAEAAPNVVPFPVKKKKQPRWKQLSLVAAAVLVVVAAGGMDGILSMRESQNAAVQEMKAADTAMPVEEDIMLEEETVEVQNDTTQLQNKKVAAPVTGGITATVTAQDTTEEFTAYDAVAAVPEVASMKAEEEPMQYSMTRSAVVEATDKVTLTVTEPAAAMAELQKAIAEAGGFEENAAESSILASIPVESYDSFVKAVETIGTLNWTQRGKTDAEALWRTVEIQLKQN